VDAEFGPDRYGGKLVDGELELERVSEFDWEDGCRWTSRAVMRGTFIEHGRVEPKALRWTYRDRVLSGNTCSAVCSGAAVVDTSSESQ
jgi:hypothetical protein